MCHERFEVSVAPTGACGLDLFGTTGADLVLLDAVLAEIPGTEVCREMRNRSEVPIIMVTDRDSEIDKVVGFEVGADDYVTKPYSPRELLARVRAVMRRRRAAAPAPADTTLVAGPVRTDLDRHTVSVRDRAVTLPLKEFELLQLLVRNSGRVLTRRQLIDRVWSPSYVGDSKTVDTHVKRLRGRIEPEPARPRHLLTVRGVGYKFQP
ncbi:response regulator transcription factor [Micromonospora sp. CPCC 206061]|uniref:response regulator transcription factor n=1 Tax=Micromonospora sp. CPCC 206061 TaxID=3122410 RepID=UPI002FEEDF2D